ncbi:MAG: 1,4-dihydroxy-2-naphthoate octaprenyltransferase [Planctomycetia bacterium]|nr:1,4-dihydroxy-2-naphthoate octaprenyltransferase [Planctomycetia bacterium]
MKTQRSLGEWLGIWMQTARPQTLPAAIAPVLAGSALAILAGRFHACHALYCLLFALFAQIAANFANDGFDFSHGIDDDTRLGPARAAAEGILSPRTLYLAALVTLGLGGIFGLLLVAVAPAFILSVGLLCALFVFLYSAGPRPLSHLALGDLLVILFFGLIPVTCTAYVQTETWHHSWLLVGAAFGLVIDNILVVNNYRDVDSDRRHGKYTTIVLFGRSFGRWFYFVNGCLALVVLVGLFLDYDRSPWHYLLLTLWLARHLIVFRMLLRRDGTALNSVLAETAKNAVILATIVLIASLT